MKAKITPEYVLTMLKELKELVNQNRFTSTNFATKYPTYYVFQKFIYSKGLMRKVYNKEQWNSIEPNIIMATEILKLYINYGKEARERYNNKAVHKKRQPKNTAMSLAKKIRIEGESWMGAVVRANGVMREEKTQKTYSEGGALPIQAFSEAFENKPIEKNVDKPSRELPLVDSERIFKEKEEEIQGLYDALYKINREKEAFRHENSHYKNVNIAEQVQNKNYKQQLEKITEDRDLLYSNVELHIKENKVLLKKYSQLENKLEDYKFKLQNKEQLIEKLEERQAYLIEKLKERQEVIDELIDRDNVKKESEKQEEVILSNSEPIFYRDLTSQEIMSSKPLTSKSTRTFKVLGIPIFTIDNK